MPRPFDPADSLPPLTSEEITALFAGADTQPVQSEQELAALAALEAEPALGTYWPEYWDD